MNPKISKITGEIEKTREKISDLQSRLKELERQKTELENADILALVRGIDIQADEFAAFVAAYKEQQQGKAVPDDYAYRPETPAAADISDNITTEEEDSQ